ncbi:Elf1-domain-containing protein [Coemansia reversa NRRL 1564]|uniref:Transcription elongation factor 1 homolog n=1 Tax=Coemansia reversa (strain ATCC 12441 / NRRL 1564) TaxID=763665 RepID=A0A2G5B1Z9_COERN|nr:Elf1-domain-containing protein [Coemansia reversa NRRL 1564]|eukprot:PIA12737.1 Elf1-domain-containing protein [Coemansia reversa NRRL 1564]
MGKRKKSSRSQAQKGSKKQKLPTNFSCLECNHENSVSVEIDKSAGIGTLRCKVCSRTFSARINHLEGPIDVYSEWVDACEAVNREERSRQTNPTQRSTDVGGYSDGGVSSDGRGYEDEAVPSRGRVGTSRNSRAPASVRSSKSRVPPPPAAALDEYGVPRQLSDDESDIDDF